MIKQFSFLQFILVKDKLFQVLLCITNYSIRHQSFVYIQVNERSFVCIQFKCQTVLFDAYIESYQVLPLQARLNLREIVMKEYSTFLIPPALLEPHQEIV